MKQIRYISPSTFTLSNNVVLKRTHISHILRVSGLLTMLLSSLWGQHQISRYERRWAFFHPLASVRIKHHLPNAMTVYAEVKQMNLLDSLAFGGKLDAFRHTYVMAYLARYVKVKKLRKLGIAHEKGNKHQFQKNRKEFGERADSLACEMDLRNNELGFLLGKRCPSCSATELKQLVLKEIHDGNAWYLKRNANNQYINCNLEPINLEAYRGIWYVPKCLVNTNE